MHFFPLQRKIHELGKEAFTNNFRYNLCEYLLAGQYVIYNIHRVAEVAREHGWHPPKSLDLDENFKPEHTLLCRELRFVALLNALFWGDLWAKSAFLGKNSASWARSALLHGIYCISY